LVLGIYPSEKGTTQVYSYSYSYYIARARVWGACAWQRQRQRRGHECVSETEKVPLAFFFSSMRVFPIKHLFVSRAFLKKELKTPERTTTTTTTTTTTN